MYPFNKSHPEWYQQDLTHLINLLVGEQIKPIIAARVPLVEAARAHAMLESRQVVGKIVLVNRMS
jgi:NADPH:quinone reductase-like Zn-dependent oxidoreductase